MTFLILGYGNPDRQDDGVAWHILAGLMNEYGLKAPNSLDINEDVKNKNIHLLFQLQLLPELAEDLYQYDHAIFIDAHIGSTPKKIEVVDVQPELQSSPLTHHLTPNRLLFITQQIYNKFPHSVLISVKGHDFQFSQKLSSQTEELVPGAISVIQEWIKSHNI